MSVMDGLMLARAVRSQAAIREAPMLLLTPRGCAEILEEARTLGVRGYVNKPVRQADLLQAIAAALGEHAADAGKGLGEGEARQPAAPSRGHILVAEDNSVNQKVAVLLLHRLGYRVDAVANGMEAVIALRSVHYDAVLMDCQMPEMDGFEATREIRVQEGGARHTVIIAMTANAMEGERERCLEAGMDDYISKPVRTEVLSAALEKWVRPD